MRELVSGPRVLLKRLRELMAEPMDAQQRLDQIVAQVASNMVAEVCSLYVLRADGILELYATHGLNPTAVHLAQLRVGQGLVGTIAATSRGLNLADAQHHPAFRYLPETGEEIYRTFLGSPLLRAGRTLGVLTVQNREERFYREDEVEALETIAMVMAEMIAAGELKSLVPQGIELDLTRPASFSGRSLCDGIGLGYVLLHEPRVVVTSLFAENREAELSRLTGALNALRLSIDDMLARGDVSREGEHREVLEAYRMFAHDRGWVRRMEEAVSNGLTAEAAVEKIQNDTRARMINLSDSYLRERMHDFNDLSNRLLRQLMGHDPGLLLRDLPGDAIIVSHHMGAAELLDYPREKIRGVVLEEGAATSHVVIVARAMGVPIVGQVKGVVSMAEQGDAIIADGDSGQVHLRPSADLEQSYGEKVKFRAKRQERYHALRDVPAVTRDGVSIDLQMNAGLLVDLPQLDASGATGIGLFRTELAFMAASTFPRVKAQEKLYRSIIEASGDRDVTFRTLDIGGDKVLPYLRHAKEENPAMGWRAIRLSLDRPGLMRTQVRALLKAADGKRLKLLLPMVTQISEIEAARALIDKEIAYLSRFGYVVPRQLEVGVMLEVPSLLFQLDIVFKSVDFVSVGSNDLFQFMMASDRANTKLSDRFHNLDPAFLRALRSVVDAADAHGKPLTLCGEMAGQPLAAMALIGLGYRSLSMSSASIGPIKSMVLAIDQSLLKDELDRLFETGATADEIDAAMRTFAARYSVPL